MSFSPSPSPSPFPLWARPSAGDILLCSASCETEEFQAFSQSGSSPAPQTPLSDYQNVDWSQQQFLHTPNDPQIFVLPDRSVGLAPSPAPPPATAATTPSTTTPSTTTTSSVAVRPRDDNDADDAAGQSPSKRAKPAPAKPAPPRTPTTTKPSRPRKTMAPAPTPKRRRARAQQTTPPSSSSSGSGSSPPTQNLTFTAPSTPGNMYESLAASGLRTDKYRPLQTGGRKGFRGREAKLLD
ncbi:MAG: hypothetical protein LQ339_004007 [Xanthoria mediterranea]|nr:MAG: hypothetical protein LQ339_004007 [Xanthoria mediterranea]